MKPPSQQGPLALVSRRRSSRHVTRSRTSCKARCWRPFPLHGVDICRAWSSLLAQGSAHQLKRQPGWEATTHEGAVSHSPATGGFADRPTRSRRPRRPVAPRRGLPVLPARAGGIDRWPGAPGQRRRSAAVGRTDRTGPPRSAPSVRCDARPAQPKPPATGGPGRGRARRTVCLSCRVTKCRRKWAGAAWE